MDARPPRPVSTRHAFALAFDLAFRRDPVHSLLVPFLLRSPWIAALALLPPIEESERPASVLLVSSLAAIGGALAWLLVDAMLRFRARSVFNMPADLRPAPALDCYTAGMRRVGWLYVTEFVRYLALLTGFGVFLVPGIWLSYRLAYATEAVVLSERTLAAAFRHSFHLARRRFERWLEMLLVSVTIVLGVCLLVALLYMIPGALRSHAAGYVASLLLVLIWPVFQYAWTFFYLRLIEVEEPGIIEAGPTYAAVSTPHDQAGGAGLAPGGSPPEAIGT